VLLTDRARVLAAITYAALAVSVAHAQEPVRSLSQLYHTSWTTRDGAPPDVSAFAQTPDGYLWLGGIAGLFRFDGVRFVPYQPAAADAEAVVNVTRLLVTRDGRLWVGYASGRVSMIARDSIRDYGGKDGLPSGNVLAMAQDSVGVVWVGTIGGLAKFDGVRWYAVGSEAGFTSAQASGIAEVTSIIVDRRGQLWIAAGEGIFRRTREAALFELIERKPRPTSGGWDQYLAEGPDGTIWASDRRGLRIVAPPSGKSQASRVLPEVPDAIRLAIDRTGVIWISTHDGLQRVVPGVLPMVPERERLNREGGLSGGEVNAFFEDREGNLWVGTGSGLDRFRRSKLTRIELPPGTLGPFALAAGDSGSVWIGPSSHPPIRIGRSIERFPAVQKRVESAYADAEGTIWLGGDRGLWQSTHGGFARVQLPSVHFITVQAITRDDSGGIWVSLTRRDSAVYRREAGRWVVKRGPAGLPNGMAWVMTTDDAGNVWLGYLRLRSVAMWSKGKGRTFGESEGLRLGGVLAIHARGPHVWAGGEQGLALLTGDRFRSITSKGGPAFRMITGIVEALNGDLWLHSATGIARVPAAEAQRAMADTAYQVSAEWLDYRDGLDGAAPVGPAPSMIEASDGRLWFGTNLEVASIDPNRISRNPHSPPVVIERVTAGQRSYAIANGLRLPINTRSLRIEFTALSLSMPERVRFRYELKGSDDGWQESGGRREAAYTNLRPGSYQFRVIAANEDGVWNESGATLHFTIPPSFTQSRWFVAVWAVALTALVFVAYRVRVRQVAAGIRGRYQVALAERGRIAQELHDTLLQGFTGITIQLRAIQRVLSRRPETEVAALDAVLASAETTLRDARHAIWDMRAVELEDRDLAEALEAAVRSVLSGTPVALHFTVSGDRRPLTLQVETTALRIGREAVLNALKHADARTVDVRLQYGTQFLTLHVSDDGRGMAPGAPEAAASAGHLGIAGMRTRAQRAGGTLVITSESGRGTELRASLPIGS
jgi:signal transduction histidine kinase/ligand-binding sensor domain-containing protein